MPLNDFLWFLQGYFEKSMRSEIEWYFCQLKFYIYFISVLPERQRPRERDCPSVSCLLCCPQQSSVGQAEPGTQSSSHMSHMGVRESTACTISCSLPVCTIVGSWTGSGVPRTWIRQSDMRCGHSNVWLYSELNACSNDAISIQKKMEKVTHRFQ